MKDERRNPASSRYPETHHFAYFARFVNFEVQAPFVTFMIKLRRTGGILL